MVLIKLDLPVPAFPNNAMFTSTVYPIHVGSRRHPKAIANNSFLSVLPGPFPNNMTKLLLMISKLPYEYIGSTSHIKY